MQDVVASSYWVRIVSFVVSILEKCTGRNLKDVLEVNVDEKYYLSEKMISCFENRTAIAKEKGNGFRFNPTDGGGHAKAITTCAGNRTDDNFIKEQCDTSFFNTQEE